MFTQKRKVLSFFHTKTTTAPYGFVLGPELFWKQFLYVLHHFIYLIWRYARLGYLIGTSSTVKILNLIDGVDLT